MKIREKGCLADIVILTDTVLGALKKILDMSKRRMSVLKIDNEPNDVQDEEGAERNPGKLLRKKILPISTGLPETERRNIRSMKLDSMPLPEAVELMIDEEGRGNRAIREHVTAIATLVEKITSAFRTGGRFFYVGAGTSGRLGILDASECPPTFKVPSHWVQGLVYDLYLAFSPNFCLFAGIIAGGTKAIQNSIEGAEDSVEDGQASIIDKDVCDKDVVLG